MNPKPFLSGNSSYLQASKSGDDLTILKREKQNLIQEKSLLKAKIVRMNSINKHPRQHIANLAVQNSLEKEVRQIEQITASKRAEIALIKASDRAAVIEELQEECLMLYMEIKRVQKLKKETETNRKNVSEQLKKAKELYSPEIISMQQKEIEYLQNEIKKQADRNAIIRDKLNRKEDEKDQPNEHQLFMEKTIESLDLQITLEQEQILMLNEKLSVIEKDHKDRILDLQRKLKALSS